MFSHLFWIATVMSLLSFLFWLIKPKARLKALLVAVFSLFVACVAVLVSDGPLHATLADMADWGRIIPIALIVTIVFTFILHGYRLDNREISAESYAEIYRWVHEIPELRDAVRGATVGGKITRSRSTRIIVAREELKKRRERERLINVRKQLAECLESRAGDQS